MLNEMARIWADILEVDEIPLDASFYDFGGTSLQAMRICARIERDTGIVVTPDALFEADTFSDFVAGVTSAPAAADRS
jgi:acyl carrier protein